MDSDWLSHHDGPVGAKIQPKSLSLSGAQSKQLQLFQEYPGLTAQR